MSTQFKGQCCKNCMFFYSELPDRIKGQCRARPPIPMSFMTSPGEPPSKLAGVGIKATPPSYSIQSIFPPMTGDDPGCGQFWDPARTGEVDKDYDIDDYDDDIDIDSGEDWKRDQADED